MKPAKTTTSRSQFRKTFDDDVVSTVTMFPSTAPPPPRIFTCISRGRNACFIRGFVHFPNDPLFSSRLQSTFVFHCTYLAGISPIDSLLPRISRNNYSSLIDVRGWVDAQRFSISRIVLFFPAGSGSTETYFPSEERKNDASEEGPRSIKIE